MELAWSCAAALAGCGTAPGVRVVGVAGAWRHRQVAFLHGGVEGAELGELLGLGLGSPLGRGCGCLELGPVGDVIAPP